MSVAHPQANRQVEVTNRTIVDCIKTCVVGAKGSWVEEIDSVLWACRTCPKTTIGESPFNLLHGSTATIPTEIGMQTHTILNYDENKNMGLLRENLDMIEEERGQARVRTEKYKQQIKAVCNEISNSTI